MPGQPALEAHGLTKAYGGLFGGRVIALDRVDFAIPTGSICALVGPNGAGKSTMIRAFVGFERPSAGTVAVAGINPWRRRSAALSRIGYVPQTASLYRSLTIAQHLEMAAAMRPGFDRTGARERLERLGIPVDRAVSTLSGGQQAQASLALALGTRAPALLLDEPLASLDPLARREFLHVLVQAVRSQGSTALLSSHVITDIESACDRLIVLGGGRILLDDTLSAAVADHRIARPAEHLQGARIAVFPDEKGELQALWRAAGGGRSPALDEVVLGYLAAGRLPTGQGTNGRAN